MFSVLILSLIVKLCTSDLYENCWECLDGSGVCCDDPITKIDTLICKHWISNSASATSFGAPIDVCFGRFGGDEASSVSQMYKCSADGSTVELYDYTGCSDCECTPTLRPGFGEIFNPQLYPDRDTFNCSGPPCPYYMIEDGTAHPTQTCPFDLGKEWKHDLSVDDYATWHVKMILEGCQGFDGTSTLLMCDSNNGILQMNFGNDRCDFDPNNGGGNTDNKTLQGGSPNCNYGTGTAIFCSNDPITTTVAATTTTEPVTTTTEPVTTTTTATTVAGDTTTTPSVTTTASGTTTTGSTTTATTAGSTTTTGSDDTTTTATDAGTTKADTTASGATKADTTSSGGVINTETTSSEAVSTGSSDVGATDPTEKSHGYRYEVVMYILIVLVYIIMN